MLIFPYYWTQAVLFCFVFRWLNSQASLCILFIMEIPPRKQISICRQFVKLYLKQTSPSSFSDFVKGNLLRTVCWRYALSVNRIPSLGCVPDSCPVAQCPALEDNQLVGVFHTPVKHSLTTAKGAKWGCIVSHREGCLSNRPCSTRIESCNGS